MQRDEFVGWVREMGELGSKEEAQRAIRATFETLRQRLAGREPGPGCPGPRRSRGAFTRGEGGREGFSLAEFYRRVAGEEGVDEQ